MDTKKTLVQFSPEDLGEFLGKAADQNETELLYLVSDLLSFNRPVFVPLETAKAFQALSFE